MSRGFIAVLAAAIVIAVVIAGCGGGGSSSASTSSLTKAEFIKQGDKICTTGNEEIEAGFKESTAGEENKEPSKAEAIELSETVLLPAVKKESEELRALGVPSGGGEITSILDKLDEAIEEGEENPEALVSSESEELFGPVNKQATAYGFKVCGH